jgi:hypothetical protein
MKYQYTLISHITQTLNFPTPIVGGHSRWPTNPRAILGAPPRWAPLWEVFIGFHSRPAKISQVDL